MSEPVPDPDLDWQASTPACKSGSGNMILIDGIQIHDIGTDTVYSFTCERTYEHLVLFCRNIVPLRAGFELKLKSLLVSEENVPDQDPQEKANDIEHRKEGTGTRK